MSDDESVDATLQEENSAEDTEAEVDWQKRYTDTQAEYTRNQQALKEHESVWEDEQTFLARVQEKFPHLLADEEDEETEDGDDFDDDAEGFISKAEFEKYQKDQEAQRVQAEATRQFATDLKEVVGDRTLDDYSQDVITYRAQRGQIKNKDDLAELVNALLERTEPPKKRPRAPHVPAGGKAGTGVKDFSQMSRDEINDHMVERARALEAQ